MERKKSKEVELKNRKESGLRKVGMWSEKVKRQAVWKLRESRVKNVTSESKSRKWRDDERQDTGEKVGWEIE